MLPGVRRADAVGGAAGETAAGRAREHAMRYATVTLTWDDGRVHPVDDLLAREDDVRVTAVRYVSPGPEGRYVELLELEGDLSLARRLLADSPDVIEFDVTGAAGRGVAYVQCRTAGLVDDLLAALHGHQIVVDWPMEYLRDGTRGLRVTAVGTSRAIQRAAADLPAGVDLVLERTGEYDPDAGRPGGPLTERQRELLELAAAEGYYEVPRRTTHRELAAKLGVSAGTVSERLQRVEARLVDAFLDSA